MFWFLFAFLESGINVYGYMGCFRFLAIVNNNTVMNISVQVSVFLLLILLGVYPKVELLDHLILLLIFWVTPTLFSVVTAPFYIDTAVHEGPGFFISLITLVIFCVCIIAILMGVKRYLIGLLIWLSLVITDIEHLFHEFIGHSCIFFGELSIQLLCPLMNQVVIYLFYNIFIGV